jgi:hypothetical protein
MRTEKELLEEYKQADMGRRLNLYLQFREYREEFLLMDMEGNHIRKAETSTCCGKRTNSLKGREIKPWRKFLIDAFACR